MKLKLAMWIITVVLLAGCSNVLDYRLSASCAQPVHQQSCNAPELAPESMPGSCTSFAVQIADKVLFGNNEDYENPMTYYWIIPSTDDGYGGIYLGYEYGRPQGGINEKGLAFDGLALPPEAMNYHPDRPDTTSNFTGFMAKVMQQCADVGEAEQMMTNYNWTKGTVAHQILIADAAGDAAVIGAGTDGELAVTRKRAGDGFLLATNFNLVQLEDKDFKIPCRRYKKAQQMLEKIEKKRTLSVDASFQILDAVHQEGRTNNTLYSNVFDLKNGMVYLTYWYQFDEVITLNVAEEVNNRTRTGYTANASDKVRLRTLFSEKTVTKAEKAFRRYLNGPETLEKVAWVWVCQSVICAGLLSVDLLRQTHLPWYVKVIWLPVGFFFGVVGLLVYGLTFKRPLTRSGKISIFIRVFGSAALSVVGCTFAILLIFLSASFVDRDANLGVFALLIPFVVGLLLFRMPMVVFLYALNYWKGVLRYILPEFISSIVAVALIVIANQSLSDFFNQYSRAIGNPADIIFWAQFSIYAFTALLAVLPIHLLLIHMKVKLWPMDITLNSEVIQLKESD